MTVLQFITWAVKRFLSIVIVAYGTVEVKIHFIKVNTMSSSDIFYFFSMLQSHH